MNYGDSQDELQIYSNTHSLYYVNSISFVVLDPAYPRNEYLNDGNARCGEVDVKQE